MQLRRNLFLFLSLSLFFLFIPQVIYAVTITISNAPSSISSDQFSINVTVNSQTNGTNYLRVDLFKDGTTNYFGETYNGSSWYGGSDDITVNYPPITINGGSGSAVLQGRVGNLSSGYQGSGSYKLRIRRYTNSGGSTSGDQQTPLDVQIAVALVSPAPTPAATPRPSPTPAATAAPAATRRPSSNPTVAPRTSPKASPAKGASPSPDPSDEAEVLGVTASSEPSPSSGVASPSAQTKMSVGIFLMIFGVIISGVAGFFIYRQSQMGKSVAS